MPGQSTKRACATAQARAINVLKSEPEFTSINHERLLVLLSSKTPSLSRSDLIEASLSASNLDLDAELAKLVHQALPFDGDDAATKRLLYLALEAGMRACNADEAFKDEIKSTQLLYLVQSLARVGQRLDRIEDRRTANENRLIEQLQDKADALHVTRQLFIALAKRITADVLDFDQAYRELERPASTLAGVSY